MNSSFVSQIKKLVCGSFLLSMFFFGGCPNPNPDPDGQIPSDGGTVDQKQQPLTCEKGTLCLKISNKDARACDILLKDGATLEAPRIAFSESTIGQSQYRDSRLALSFISRRDEGLGASEIPVLIQLKAGVSKVEIVSAACYDRKGKKIEKPDIVLERP